MFIEDRFTLKVELMGLGRYSGAIKAMVRAGRKFILYPTRESGGVVGDPL